MRRRLESECRRRDARQRESISHWGFGREDLSSAGVEALSGRPHFVLPVDICRETDGGKGRRCKAVDRRLPVKVCEEIRWPNAVAESFPLSEGRHGIRREAVELSLISGADYR